MSSFTLDNDSLSVSSPMQLLLILNPVSGRKAGRKFFPEIIRTFTDAGYLVTSYVTGYSGDAQQYAAKYGGRFSRIVCIGGDGTLNEIVSGLSHGGHTTSIGYIPSGSTNDFAACHGISSNKLAAARDAALGTPVPLDIGLFGDDYFTYVAAFGAFSWLSYTTPQNLKNLLGHTAYILDGIKDLSMIKPEQLTFSSGDAVYSGSFIFGAVCNSTSIAGTISIPLDQVDMNDGLFEVLLIRSPATVSELQGIIGAIINQNFSQSPLIQFFRTDCITVDSPNGTAWTLDGEYAGLTRKVEIKNIHNALSFVVNK